jgi:hypothetical protein
MRCEFGIEKGALVVRQPQAGWRARFAVLRAAIWPTMVVGRGMTRMIDEHHHSISVLEGGTLIACRNASVTYLFTVSEGAAVKFPEPAPHDVARPDKAVERRITAVEQLGQRT